MAIHQQTRPPAASGGPSPVKDSSSYYLWLFLGVPGAYIGARKARRDGRFDVARNLIAIGVAMFVGFLLFFGFIGYQITSGLTSAFNQPLTDDAAPSLDLESSPASVAANGSDNVRLQQQLETCRAAGGADYATGQAGDSFAQALKAFHAARDAAHANSNTSLLLCAYLDPDNSGSYQFHRDYLLELASLGDRDLAVSTAPFTSAYSQTDDPPTRTGCYTFQSGQEVGADYEATLHLVDGFWMVGKEHRLDGFCPRF